MTWRLAYWIIFACALGVYGTMLGWTLPAVSAGADGLVPFDMRPGGYTGEEARQFLAVLSDEGRKIYLGPQHKLDLVYPTLLAVVLIGAAWALVPARGLVAVLIAAALVGAGADYLENLRVAGLLTYEGEVTDSMVAAANQATLIKSGATTLAMCGVLVALISAGWRKWIRR